MQNPDHKVDLYLEEGCGRCALYQTPNCKVRRWTAELNEVRRIILDCGLEEAYKWSQPCYMYKKSNILLVAAMKEYVVVAFFKGTLLADPQGILVSPGPDSQSIRQLRFTRVQEILEMESILKAYIFEALEVEKMGLKVEFRKTPASVPSELLDKFEEMPGLKSAFEALTPGRQRGYMLYFSQAKQSKTREARIEKYLGEIFKGKGLHDR